MVAVLLGEQQCELARNTLLQLNMYMGSLVIKREYPTSSQGLVLSSLEKAQRES